MQEQKGGRSRSEEKQVSLRISKNTDEMLSEIQEFTGAATIAEAIRLCVFDFHRRNIKKIEEKS